MDASTLGWGTRQPLPAPGTARESDPTGGSDLVGVVGGQVTAGVQHRGAFLWRTTAWPCGRCVPILAHDATHPAHPRTRAVHNRNGEDDRTLCGRTWHRRTSKRLRTRQCPAGNHVNPCVPLLAPEGQTDRGTRIHARGGMRDAFTRPERGGTVRPADIRTRWRMLAGRRWHSTVTASMQRPLDAAMLPHDRPAITARWKVPRRGAAPSLR